MADPAPSSKPDMQPAMVRKLLEGHFERPIHNLKPLEGGEVGQTFAFTVQPANETAPRESDFFGKWHSLFRDTFLERDLFDRLYQRMMQLTQYVPAERALVHGDYGFRNVLAQDGRITGVLDWMDARYGDSLYDVAWLDFWSPADGWRDRLEQHYRARGLKAPEYTQRLLCYQCYIALSGLKFFAKGRNQSAYGWVSARIGELLR